MRKRLHNRSELLLYLQHLRSLPEALLEEMYGWEQIFKSPYSPSFYSCREKRWDFTPEGCKRISNHWNFKSQHVPTNGQPLHCMTDIQVQNHYFWTLAIYKEDLWRVQTTLPCKKRGK